jgi:hypothetical protein
MRKELNMVLPGGSKNSSLLNDYNTLEKLIGGPGASLRAAEIIVQAPF